MALRIAYESQYGDSWSNAYVRICKATTQNHKDSVTGLIDCFVRTVVYKNKSARDAGMSPAPFKDYSLSVSESESLLKALYLQLKALPEFATSEDV